MIKEVMSQKYIDNYIDYINSFPEGEEKERKKEEFAELMAQNDAEKEKHQNMLNITNFIPKYSYNPTTYSNRYSYSRKRSREDVANETPTFEGMHIKSFKNFIDFCQKVEQEIAE